MKLSFIRRTKGIFKKEEQGNNRYKTPEEVTTIPPVPEDLKESYIKVSAELNHMRPFPIDLLEHLYRFMDEHNKFIATFTVCEKGCSACCSIPVNISRLEAEYIYQKAGHKVSNNSDINKTDPCPFLTDSSVCSIYKYRPYNCRTFHTLDDPKYCATNKSHAIYGCASTGYNADILSSLAAIIRETNFGEYKDIRCYFP